MVTQDPKTQGVPGALGIILVLIIKPYNQLNSEKRSAQTWVRSPDSWLSSSSWVYWVVGKVTTYFFNAFHCKNAHDFSNNPIV